MSKATPKTRAQGARLKAARIAAGFASARGAALENGWGESTVPAHERGTRTMGVDDVEKYMRVYRARGAATTPAQVLFGDMAIAKTLAIPVKGFVGAGERVDVIRDDSAPAFETFDFPADGVEAYVVKGESMRPRFLEGEIVLFEKEASIVEDLVGQYARVDTNEHGTLIKIIKRGRREDRWRLDSLNADPMEDVKIIGAWRWLGVLPAR